MLFNASDHVYIGSMCVFNFKVAQGTRQACEDISIGKPIGAHWEVAHILMTINRDRTEPWKLSEYGPMLW
jgi:hypothetical protein